MSNPNCNKCPDGYTLINGQCLQTVPQEPIVVDPGNLLTVVAGNQSALYGSYGLNLMPTIDTTRVPYTGTNISGFLLASQQTSGEGYNFIDSTGNIIYPQTGYGPVSANQYQGVSVILNDLWKKRLNDVTGIWVSPPVTTNVEVCFNFCFTIEENKTYLIGLAGDNKCKMYLNNLLYIDLNTTIYSPSSTNIPTTPFRFWHIFPVQLVAGTYTIKLCGINAGSPGPTNVASFGAEIYDFPTNDPVQWFKNNLTGPTVTEADLLPEYILFSTKDQIGQEVADPENPPVYRCPGSDVTFTDICVNGLSCEGTISAPYIHCIYKLTNCKDPEDVIYTKSDVYGYLNGIVKLIGEEFAGKCYTVEEYVGEEPVTQAVSVEKEYVNCLSCSPSYKLINCKNPETVLYTTDITFEPYAENNNVVKLVEYPTTCWIVAPNSDVDFEPETLTVDGNVFTTCEECSPSLYQLTNCYTNGSFIISDSELSSYVNDVVTLQGVPGACFTVTPLDVDCLSIIITGNTQQFVTANFTGIFINGRKQYSFTAINNLIISNYLISWNSSLNQWEIWNTTNNTLFASTPLNIINPVTSYWNVIFTVQPVSLEINYCTDIIYNVDVDKVYLNCECCNNKSCD